MLWMTPLNIALDVFAEVQPYSIEAAKTSHLPDSVNAGKVLQKRKAGLRNFSQSKAQPLPALDALEYPKHTGDTLKIKIELRR